ncbi:cyclic nucleotide-binding domain-containing protein [Ruegeria sp. R14_0]|uniref:cyclic nucleotide-binding domain-containing protein n=1 Tax=Ruegeria sp. R14_0 TaxID=2821100 RepID=UPI001ADA4875|nr:cyclic nucleotide-binding domain-containing protein [Ruegeria sp. R14_0]MBO9444627.1 cyclic nucleotide-binding domain-containing protein [Ruegeria sp. R14_0]
MIGPDILVNSANVVYLFSYSVRDILKLRILTVLGGGLLLPYFYLQTSTLWVPIGWNVFFIFINLYWIARLLAERRPVQFTEEERRLYALALQNLSEKDAFQLFRMAEHRSVDAGSDILTQGQRVAELSLIVEGEVVVEENGTRVDTLGEGNFLGAIAFLNQDGDFNTPVTVRTLGPTKLMTWKFSDLNAAFTNNSDLQISVEARLGIEISKWLQKSRQALLSA